MSFPTAPVYCPCSAFPLGNYGNGCDAPGQKMARFTGRDDRDSLMFGRENYQQAYGESYMLGFPSWKDGVYVQSLPVHDVAVPGTYRYGYPAGTPLVLVGNYASPYFQIWPGPAR